MMYSVAMRAKRLKHFHLNCSASAREHLTEQDENGSVTTIARPPALFALLLDRIPDLRRHIRPAEPCDGADAGGGGDVDLGQVAVDHVDADEQQAALA